MAGVGAFSQPAGRRKEIPLVPGDPVSMQRYLRRRVISAASVPKGCRENCVANLADQIAIEAGRMSQIPYDRRIAPSAASRPRQDHLGFEF